MLVWLTLSVTQEWKRQPDDPPASSIMKPQLSRVLLSGLLIVTSIAVACGILSAGVGLLEFTRQQKIAPISRGYDTHEYAIEKATGTPVFLQVRHTYDQGKGYRPDSIRGDSIEQGKTLELRDLSGSKEQFITSSWLGNTHKMYQDASSDGFFGSITLPTNWKSDYLWVYDSRGKVLVYSYAPEFHLAFAISPDGIQDDKNSLSERFTNNPLLAAMALNGFANASPITPLIDANGLYAFRADTKEFATLLKRKINGAIMTPLQVSEPAKLLVTDDNSITVYQFPNVKVQGNEANNSSGLPYIDFNSLDGRIEDLFKLVEVATYPLPKELDARRGYQVICSRQNRLYLFTGPMGYDKLFIISEDGKQETIAFKNFIQRPSVRPSKTEETLVATGCL